MGDNMQLPPSLPPRPQVRLTDTQVKARFAAEPHILLDDGPVTVAGKIIGWQRTNAGTLGAIVLNPLTNRRMLFGIDFRTGRPRALGEPRPPKS